MDAAARIRPALALVDVELLDADAEDGAQRMRRALGGAAMLVAVSAPGRVADRREREAGFDAYLAGPVDPRALRALVARAAAAMREQAASGRSRETP